MKIKIFDNYVDFFNFLNDYELINASASFQAFVNAYNSINKGCRCQRNSRIQNAVNTYRDIVGILQSDEDLLELIKIQGQYSEIQMYHEGVLLYKA